MTHVPECFCAECAPWPGDVDVRLLGSPAYRLERGRGLAAWLRLPRDAWEDFAQRYDAGWRRQRAAEVDEAKLRDELTEYWARERVARVTSLDYNLRVAADTDKMGETGWPRDVDAPGAAASSTSEKGSRHVGV